MTALLGPGLYRAVRLEDLPPGRVVLVTGRPVPTVIGLAADGQ